MSETGSFASFGPRAGHFRLSLYSGRALFPVALVEPTGTPRPPPLNADPVQVYPWASTGSRMMDAGQRTRWEFGLLVCGSGSKANGAGGPGLHP